MSERPGDIPKKDYFRVKNDWWDALVRYGYLMTKRDRQVLDYIIRSTYGWQRKWAEISIWDFTQATGILRTNVHRSIKALLRLNIIKCIKNDSKRWPSYSFNKYFRTWNTVSKPIIDKKQGVSNEIQNESGLILNSINPDTNSEILPIKALNNRKDIKGQGEHFPKKPKRKPKNEPKKQDPRAIELYEFFRDNVLTSNKCSRKGAIKNISFYLSDNDPADLKKAIENYIESTEDQEPRYRTHAANFFGRAGKNEALFEAFLPGEFKPAPKPKPKSRSQSVGDWIRTRGERP